MAETTRMGNLARGLRRHWLLLVLLVGGALLRVVATAAYRPALLYYDSERYLGLLVTPDPGGTSPLGYPVLLLGPALLLGQSLTAAAIANHLLGLAMAVAIYVFLLRWRSWRWLAALATVPVLFDAYWLQVEEMVMSEILFSALLLAVLMVLAWRPQPGIRIAGLAGLLLAAVLLTRLFGVAAGIPAVLFLLAVGQGWRRKLTTAAVAATLFVVPLAGYALYFQAWHPGMYRITKADTKSVYARVAMFADCRKFDVPDHERVLCQDIPPDERPGQEFYRWSDKSPRERLDPPRGMTKDEVLADFCERAILHQPGELVQAITVDFLWGFSWSKEATPRGPSVERWHFTTDRYAYEHHAERYVERWDGGEIATRPQWAGFLVAYQQVFFVRGTVVACFLLLAVAAGIGLGRAKRSGMRAVTLLAAGLPVSALLVAACSEFSWRYQLPGIVLLPVAGALGIVAILRRMEDEPVTATETVASDESTDAAALREFAERYGDARLAPVAVVIAAYEEEQGIGTVVDTLPKECCGLDIDVVVVDDGSKDKTAEVAREHGAYVCQPPRNRGQGAALRLGYQIARERGAQYIITTDADGQYDNSEMPLLLQPLIDDEADFVSGSRSLGSNAATDSIRRMGTPFFAWMVTLLTRTKITDTTFGFRAMKAEVTGAVTLLQPQYQASELLIGVLANGYRVLEQPMAMLKRNQGSSKKGNNIVYGWRFSRVVLGTWAREFLPRKRRSRSTKRAANSTT